MTRRRAIRFSLLVLLCLLLGTMTTIGTAWYCQWQFDGQRRAGFNTELVAAGWPSWVDPEWPPPKEAALEELRGWRQESLVHSDPPAFWSATSESSGWPLLALWRRSAWPVARTAAFPSLWMGLDVQHPQRGFMHLPVIPLWPGFAIDTALYAAAWSLLLFTPLPLYRLGRRRFRVSRGMCGSCGYDLRGAVGGVCAECGADPEQAS